MHSDDGLKARIEEVEKDLLFYLRKYHELTSSLPGQRGIFLFSYEFKNVARWTE